MRLGLFITAGVIALMLLLSAVYIVDQREQALVLQFGEPVAVVKDAGLHFKIPFIQNVERFDKRILDLNARPREVIGSDKERLIVDAFVKFRIKDPLKFYQSVQTQRRGLERLDTFLESSLRQVLGSVQLSTLLTGERGVVMQEIRDDVGVKAEKLGLKVVDVRIMRADLPEKNSQAIYRRMQTEREREAKELRAQGDEESQRIRSRADRERVIILAEAKKQAEEIRGAGEAEATKIFADSFSKDSEFYAFYRSMNAYRETLTEGDTNMILSPDSDFMRFFGDIYGKKRAN